MNRFDQDWQKLVALARQAPATDDDLLLPPGFATRMAALGATPSAPPWGGLERVAVRGFVAALTCCAAAVAYSYFDRSVDFADVTDTDDMVAVLLDLS